MRSPEHDQQVLLFRWASHYRELDCMYAIPNGGHRDVRVAARLKAEGVKAGVPDICLPIPRDGHGAAPPHSPHRRRRPDYPAF